MKIKLIINEKPHEISFKAACLSGYIKNLIDVNGEITEDNKNEEFRIPILNIEEDIMKKIIEFNEYFVNDNVNSEKIKKIPKPLSVNNIESVIPNWYYNFIIKMDIETIFSIIKSANFLEISELLELSCAIIASIIRGKSVDEIRETFGIVNDFTPEEEQEIINENKWCEDL